MITNGIKCNRCLEELVLEEIFEGDYEIGPTYNFVCPNCGARFECTEVTEDDKQNYEFYADGGEDISGRLQEEDIMNGHCTNCGHKVSMCNNFMLSELLSPIILRLSSFPRAFSKEKMVIIRQITG